jgi:uncharacterized protein YneF (UPF0154 family)
MISDQLPLIALVLLGVSLWISYEIMKAAITNSLKKDIEISNKLLKEIALKQGVSDSKIDEIFSAEQKSEEASS